MSRLDELIAELCPDGVESVTLEDLKTSAILTVLIPSFKIKKNNYKESGKTPIVSQEVELISGYCDVSDDKISLNNYVCFGDHSEHIKYVDFPFVQGADGLKIMYVDESVISTRYLYHSLLNNYVKHNTYERHFKYLLETSIPLPPPEVQREIVRILDAFTELTAELTAELDARKKQYEYYQDGLLTFTENHPFADLCPDGVEYFQLKTLCTRQKGTPITAGEMKTLDKPNAPIRIFAGGNTTAYVEYGDIPDSAVITKPSIIVKSRGNIGFEYYEKPFSHKNEMWSYSTEREDIVLKYIYYYLEHHTFDFQAKAKSGKLPQISTPDTDNYKILLPPLEVQREIVRILDAFTELTAELTAELDARKKQYEHYRDQLLTFEKKTA